MIKETIFAKHGKSILSGHNEKGYPQQKFNFFQDVSPYQNWPLYVRGIGSGTWIKNCSRSRQFSDSFSLEMVTKGEFIFIQNGETFQVKAGEFFVIQLESSSKIRCDCDTPAEKYFISLGGPLLLPYLRSGSLNKISHFTNLDIGWFQRCFELACKLLTDNSPQAASKLSEMAYDILLQLWRGYQCQELPSSLIAIMNYMNQEIDRPIKIEELCHKFNQSRSGIYRLFKDHLGKSPVNYLMERRIGHASELLCFSDYSIKEIADKTGYGSARYFSSEFRRHTGKTPREYRCGNHFRQ